MKHSAALILDMRKQSILDTDPISKDEGAKYVINIKKNHIAQSLKNPYVKVSHLIIYGEGTEQILTTLNKAVTQGYIRTSGAWIYWDSEGLKWNGKQAFRAFMKENPDVLQTLRNIVNGEIEVLTDAEKLELGITDEEDNELPVDPDMLESASDEA